MKRASWIFAIFLLFFTGCTLYNSNMDSLTPTHADSEYIFESYDELCDFVKDDERLNPYRDKSGAVTIYTMNADDETVLSAIRTVSYGSYFAYTYTNSDGDSIYFIWQPTENADKYLQSSLSNYNTQPNSKDDFYYQAISIDDVPYWQIEWVEDGQYFISQIPNIGGKAEPIRPSVKSILVQP